MFTMTLFLHNIERVTVVIGTEECADDCHSPHSTLDRILPPVTSSPLYEYELQEVNI